MRTIRSLILLSLISITAPLAAAGDAAPVSLEIVDVSSVGFSRDGVEFELQGEVSRGGGLPVVLRSLDYTIHIGDEVVGQGAADIDTLKIRGGDAESIALPCALSLSSGAHAIMSSLTTGELDLRVSGEARYRILFIPRTYRFDESLSGP